MPISLSTYRIVKAVYGMKKYICEDCGVPNLVPDGVAGPGQCDSPKCEKMRKDLS